MCYEILEGNQETSTSLTVYFEAGTLVYFISNCFIVETGEGLGEFGAVLDWTFSDLNGQITLLGYANEIVLFKTVHLWLSGFFGRNRNSRTCFQDFGYSDVITGPVMRIIHVC